jgi:CheY-like chemotaxis protein
MPAKYVLTVEDDLDLGEVVSAILEAHGYRVDLIANGTLAYNRLFSEQHALPDLIILDLHLPGMSGVDILQALKADPARAGIPVMLSTADLSLGSTLAPVADEVIFKPFEADTLLSMMQKLSMRVRAVE